MNGKENPGQQTGETGRGQSGESEADRRLREQEQRRLEAAAAAANQSKNPDYKNQNVARFMERERVADKRLRDFILDGSVKNRIRQQVEAEVRRSHANEPEDQDSRRLMNEEIEKETEKRLGQVKAQVLGGMGNLMNYGNPETGEQSGMSEAQINAYVSQLRNLVNQGVLSPEEANEIVGQVKERADAINKAGMEFMQRGGGLIGWAETAGIPLLKHHKRLLNSLESPEKFKEELERGIREGDYRTDGTRGDKPEDFDLEKFWHAIRDVCEQAISVVDLQPELFFEQAFDPMYHARFYNQFMGEERNAAVLLQNRFPKFANKVVDLSTLENPLDPNQKDLSPESMNVAKDPMTYPGKIKIDICSGIAQNITGKMAEFRDAYQYFHDAEKIIDEGLGWETFAKFAEKAKSSTIDWLIFQDPDISLAYNLFIPSLKQMFYMNNRIARPDINYKKEPYNLEPAQMRALLKFLSMKEINDPKFLTDESEDALRRKLSYIRKIRLGSAVAKASTFEYWNVLQGVSMPMMVNPTLKDDPRFPGGKRAEFMLNPIGADAGIDKMKVDIDMAAKWLRVNLRRHLLHIGYVFQPRSAEGFNNFQPYHHSLMYRVKEEHENAHIRGASDWYLKFNEENITLQEQARYQIIGIWARRGWRTKEYARFIWMKENDQHYDFPKTMANLMSVGTAAVKLFIDDIKGPSELQFIDDETYAQMVNRWKAKKEADVTGKPQNPTGDDAERFRNACYKEFIYERMLNLTPTKALQFERRHLTPYGENLLLQDLWDQLIQKYGNQMHPNLIRDTLTPLFVEALELVQMKKLQKVYGEMATARSIDDIRKHYKTNPDAPESSGLTANDLNDEETKKILEIFFEQYKRNVPQFKEFQGKSGMGFMSFETFYNRDLPEFLKELKRSIYKPRVQRQMQNGETPQNINKDTEDYITLLDRFFHWQDKKLVLDAEFGAEDMDLSRFFFQRAGNRVAARFTGEENNVVTKVTKGYEKLYEVALTSFVLKRYADDNMLMQDVLKQIVPIINEMRDTIGIADAEARPEVVIRNAVFCERLIGKDSPNDIPILGDLYDNFMRRVGNPGPEGSYFQDWLVSRLDRPTTALNASQKETLERTIMSFGEVPWTEDNIIKSGYKEVGPFKIPMPDIEDTYEFTGKSLKIGPWKFKEIKTEQKKKKIGPFEFKLRVPVKKHSGAKNPWHAGMAKKLQGHTGERKFLTKTLPLIVLIALLIYIQLYLAANKANSGKR